MPGIGRPYEDCRWYGVHRIELSGIASDDLADVEEKVYNKNLFRRD